MDSQTSTITADVATIRATTARTFRDDGDANVPLDWTSADLAEEIGQNLPDHDARVLRVLAARIANGSKNEDPLLTLTDLAAALTSLTAAVATLAGRELSDDNDLESFTTYAATIDHLRDAAGGISEMAGWL